MCVSWARVFLELQSLFVDSHCKVSRYSFAEDSSARSTFSTVQVNDGIEDSVVNGPCCSRSKLPTCAHVFNPKFNQ